MGIRQYTTDLKYNTLKKLKSMTSIINAVNFWILKKRLKKIIEKIKRLNPQYYEVVVRGMFKDLNQDIILDSEPLKASKKGKIIRYHWAVLYTKYGNVKVEIWPSETAEMYKKDYDIRLKQI